MWASLNLSYLEFNELLVVQTNVFHPFGKFLDIIPSYILSTSFSFSSPSGTHIMHMLVFYIVTQRPPRSCSFFFFWSVDYIS